MKAEPAYRKIKIYKSIGVVSEEILVDRRGKRVKVLNEDTLRKLSGSLVESSLVESKDLQNFN